MNAVTTSEVLIATFWLIVATVATRAGMLLVGERFRLSRHVEAALRFAPACALSALILPEILRPAGALDLSLGNPRWPAAVVAAAFLLWRNSMLGGIAIGMTAYAAMRIWVG